METFSQYRDNPFVSYLKLESYLGGGHTNSAPSDVVSPHIKSHSDEEEVILATNRPKKRAGRKKFRETRHPVYRGVRRRNSNRWVCEVREPNKQNRIWLGTYPTAEMAARAHDVAALAFRGTKACLNFADSSWRLPVPASNEAKDIQKAAAEAAEAFRPRVFGDERGIESPGDRVLADEMMKMRSKEEASTSLNSSAGNVFYTDEEMIFGMPGLLTSMAEGLLLSPPSYLSGDFGWDDGDMHGDVSLWNHSV